VLLMPPLAWLADTCFGDRAPQSNRIAQTVAR
jgi:hypothetical protein